MYLKTIGPDEATGELADLYKAELASMGVAVLRHPIGKGASDDHPVVGGPLAP